MNRGKFFGMLQWHIIRLDLIFRKFFRLHIFIPSQNYTTRLFACLLATKVMWCICVCVTAPFCHNYTIVVVVSKKKMNDSSIASSSGTHIHRRERERWREMHTHTWCICLFLSCIIVVVVLLYTCVKNRVGFKKEICDLIGLSNNKWDVWYIHACLFACSHSYIRQSRTPQLWGFDGIAAANLRSNRSSFCLFVSCVYT